MLTPEDHVLRIGHGNVYINNPSPRRAVRLATQTHAHSWGWSEGRRLKPFIEVQKQYNGLWPTMPFDQQEDAEDCPMMLMRGLKVEHYSFTRACQDITGSKVGHARTFPSLAFRFDPWFRQIVQHIHLHPNWIMGFNNKTDPVLQEYIDSMHVFRNMLEFAFGFASHVVVTGDFNVTEEEAKTRQHPNHHSIMEEWGMKGRMENVDGIYWSPSLKLKSWRNLPKQVTNSDHETWNIADLVRNR